MAHVSDARAGIERLVLAEHRYFAVRWAEKTGKNAEESGFAGAVFADENVALAGLEVD
jgi:hypothetical protein